MIKFRERDYNSFYEIADEYSIPLNIFKIRLNCGWSIDQAVDIPVHKTYNIPVYATEDKVYKSYLEVSKDFNIDVDLLVDRIIAGWDISDILEHPEITDKIYVGGIRFTSFSAVANYYGVSLSALKKNVSRGMSMLQYINWCNSANEDNGNLYKLGEPFSYRGLEFKTFKDFVKQKGLNLTTVSNALRKKIDINIIINSTNESLVSMIESAS